ncbi:diguanylate cyclase (GGDEF) domain-containing protein [Noviherbaspirillum humi]|uniref:diguanylate cyclase n=1 Tax=Noviherbaspirillum humi TaxID=1688639 RepID=A0A239KF93_9BURK|nr:GGDEF domain-containing protein [Noviherbaspirillum humi]SNT16313.1 diguanylate cyclase (GGDEF) domain-containing protein [Noviherbaspirillum humi]
MLDLTHPAKTPSTFGTGTYSLQGVQLFDGASLADVAPLLAHCPVLRIAAGTRLERGADQPARLYVVLSGALEVGTDDERSDGSSSRVLAGECTGELSVLEEDSGAERIRALQESELLMIDAPTVWRLIDASNGVARNLLRLLSFRIRAANAQLRRRQKLGEFYRQLSMVDGLTGLQNRAWLDSHFPGMVDEAQAGGNPLSVILIDLDHFKRFNDEHGHLVGDEALKAAGKAITGALRPTDFAVRYGGEELMVILPGTGQAGGMMVAERLRERLRQSVIFSDMRLPLPHMTASLGVATFQLDQSAPELIAAADAALYRAKEAGRDRISL